MTKPRRRQAGEGGISEYRIKARSSDKDDKGIRYWAKYRMPLEDGTTREVLQRGFLTRKAAADFLTDKRAEIRRGVHVVPSKITVGQWLDQWLRGLRLAPSTRASYAKNARLHLGPQLGQIQLSRLTGTRISTLYRDLERNGRQDHASGTGLSARTVRYIHTILKAALSEAVRQGLIAVNPADKAKPPSAKEARPPEIHPLSAEELFTVLAWADERGCPDAVAWRVLAFSAGRRGEVLGLRWSDFAASTGKLSIRRSVGLVRVKGEGYTIQEGPPKNGKQRTIKLDRRTVDALRRYRLARASLDLRLARDDALIFGTLEGQHQHPERFSRRFSEALARCRRELGDDAPPMIRLHDLRHTWATIALQKGIHPKVVQERLGHANISITLDVYSHVIEGLDQDAAEEVAAIVGGEL